MENMYYLQANQITENTWNKEQCSCMQHDLL